MTTVNPAEVIEQLFKAANVERVISVDDMYANDVAEAIGMALVLPAEALQKVFADYPAITTLEDPDILSRQIRELWPGLDVDKQDALLNALEKLQEGTKANPAPTAEPAAMLATTGNDETIEEASSEAEIDEQTITILPELLKTYKPLLLSLKAWKEKKDKLFPKTMPRTLILVDENFEKEGGLKNQGIQLIRELLKEERSEVLCALLSHNYTTEDIHQQWNDLCAKENLPKSKFVLIPKSLVHDEPLAFARLVKLAILNGDADTLKAHVSTTIKDAHDRAAQRMGEIDIYDFDQIVFRSSEKEGVWEPDTLLRVFSLFHRDEVRKLAKSDAQVHELAAKIRSVSEVPTHSTSSPTFKTWKVQRIEYYEDDAYLNPHCLPIELGDIFQKENGGKRYILLGQPCDLMVRSDGTRHHLIKEALLAEITAKVPKDINSHAELEYFDADDPKTKYFANFKSACAIKLDVLDFCVFNGEGKAIFVYDKPCPSSVIPAWKERHTAISKFVEKTVRHFEELRKAKVPETEATRMLTRCSNDNLFSGKINVVEKSISYNFRRVGRLRAPRSTALLARYANFIARQAFDHDFGPDEIDLGGVATDEATVEPKAASTSSD